MNMQFLERGQRPCRAGPVHAANLRAVPRHPFPHQIDPVDPRWTIRETASASRLERSGTDRRSICILHNPDASSTS